MDNLKYTKIERVDNKKVAVFDCDDTLFFTGDSLRLASKEVFNRDLTRLQIKKLPPNIRANLFITASKKYHTAYKPNKLTIDKCKILKSKGYDIIVLTTRWNTLRKYTLKILSNNNIPFKKLILDRDGSTDGEKFKIHYIKSLLSKYKQVIFFDDSIEIMRKVERLNSLKRVSLYLVSPTRIRLYRAG